MSAHTIYDCTSLGSIIRYSDGTARPPARFRKKLSAWESRNGTGRLVKKEPPRSWATFSSPVRRTWSVESDLRFEIVERPSIGMVRVLQDIDESPELLHLARDREAAERWLASNSYDEVSADVIEGRAAA